MACQHFKTELWFPTLLDRDYYDTWLEKGAGSTEERCRARKEELLQSYEIEPPDENAVKEIDNIVEAAKNH